jgi:ATP adenylyltransferase
VSAARRRAGARPRPVRSSADTAVGARAKRAPARAARRAGAPAPVSAAGLDRLWAPWRMSWLRHADGPHGCLFCRVAAERADRRDLVLARNAHALLMLNRYPYASAHLMVALRRHAGQFHELTAEETLALMQLTGTAERALAAEYAPHGLNVGLNVGRVAGAGFPGHLHLHLVPRWNGDTNFMPAIAQTRVLPESLEATWKRLRRAGAARDAGAARGRRAAGSRRARRGPPSVNAATRGRGGRRG